MARTTAAPIPDAPATIESALLNRARRHRRKRRFRKAAVALSLLANRTGEARHYAMLGAMWMEAGRTMDALAALRQAILLHRRNGAMDRARTVARLVARLEPNRPLRAA